MSRSQSSLTFMALLIGAASGCSQQPAVEQRPVAVTQPAAVVEKAVAEQPLPAAAEGDASRPPAATLAELRSNLAAADDPDARIRIVDEIAALGRKAQPALPDLVKATTAADSRLRWHAARGIGLIGEDAITALPTLIGLLTDDDPIVVAQAAAAIALIRKDDERTETPAQDAALYALAFDPLVQTVVHPDPRVRRAALRALKVLTPSPAALLPIFSRQITDSDPSVVLPALHTLADMKGDAMPFLLEAMKNPKSRYWASVALSEIGPEAVAAVEPLAALAVEGEIDERLQAILALAAIGEPAKIAGPALMKTLESNEELLQFAAVFALGKLRVAEADAALKRTAESENDFLGSVAAWARAQLNPGDKALVADAVDRLQKGLDSDTPSMRYSSVSGLSDLASFLDAAGKARLATEFADLIADADPQVSLEAGGALVRLGGPAVAPLKAKLTDSIARVPAIEILGTIGLPAKSALPEMILALADADESYRSDAAVAIASFGTDATEAVPALMKLLQAASNTPGTMYAAAYALGRIGPAAKPALEKLRELANSDDELMATVAVWSALKIDPLDTSLFEAAVPKLRKALRGDREMARLEAAVALGDIGAVSKPALPLLELVSEEDPLANVRKAAKLAIAKILAAETKPVAP